ncbi:MAG: VCBS repeat-containing protein [Anaerolineae bacterium]|nr:VCBS repeat-containing protein [Anaerolineae bacterium]
MPLVADMAETRDLAAEDILNAPPAPGDPPIPLPRFCDGVTPPGETPPACCIFGYVYYDDEPVDGASITIESPSGALEINTANGGASAQPHYGADLISPPLSANVGSVITITASYSDMISIRTWIVQSGGQQVDIGLVDGYQAASPLSVDGLDLTVVRPTDVRALNSTGVPFGSATVITDTLWNPRSTYASDLDNDGDLDVLSASINDDTIAWYENDGNSAPMFTSHIITAAADGAFGVYAADLDGDSDMDVLSASFDADEIAWYENDGGSPPSFVSHVITDTADEAVFVYAADLDNDGDVDVLSASRGDDTVAWYENDGNSPPAFTSHIITTGADLVISVYAADLDGDSDMDVLSASRYDDTIAWYENSGGPSPVFTAHAITTEADGARAVYAADVDRDGDIDVLGASWNDHTVAWYENNGDTPLTFTPHVIAVHATLEAATVYATDADNDGDVDVLAGFRHDVSNGQVIWYENDGSASLAFTAHLIADDVFNAVSVSAADIDSDGDADILSVKTIDGTDNGQIVWYENQAIHRSAAFPEQSAITNTADEAKSVYAADIDGDGDVDILSASGQDDTIAWYENDGSPSPTFASHVITNTADGAFAVYATDLDRDGDIDVLSASENDDKIVWYENGGEASPAFTSHTITTSADSARSVFAIDLDKDGDMDILSASANDDKIAWYENDGGTLPVFDSHTITTMADSARSVFAIDLDNDGDKDVLSASADDGKVAWYENDGSSSPTFISHTVMTGTIGADSVYAVDLDSDGDVDILATSWQSDTVAWYENDGASLPTFTSHSIVTNADGAISVYAADLDQDGDLDVVSASARDSKIAWYENDGSSPPVFDARIITRNSDWVFSIYPADMDNDGDLDILSASWNEDEIAWFENQGGQFALSATDTAPFSILTDQRDDILQIEAIHRGRTGDLGAELGSFALQFEDVLGNPLTTLEANNLIETLAIYRDDGSGLFEPFTDTLVAEIDALSLVTGTQVITFASGDPNVHVAFGSPVNLFAAVELTDDAITQVPDRFRVTHLHTGTGNSAKYRDYDLALTIEGMSDQASSVTTAPSIYHHEHFVPFGTGTDRTFALAWGDADNDGFQDLAVGNHGQNQICWNNGDHSFDCQNAFGSGMTFDVEWGDMNGDNWLDLVVTRANGQANQVCLNNQDRTFSCSSFSTCSGATGDKICYTALGDIDRDGNVDIVLGTLFPEWYTAPDIVYYNQGDATFPVTTTTCNTGSTLTRDLKVGDLNNDGYPDLVVADNIRDYLCINHDGVLSERRWLPSGASFSTALGDADGDGDLDIAMGANFGAQDRLYLNDGSALFSTTISFHRAQRTYSLAFGDIDGDGRPDLASGDYYRQIVYFNVPITTAPGMALVQAGYLDFTITAVNSVAFADIDNDGDLDLAETRDRDQNVIYINHLNPPNAVFIASPLIGTAPLDVQFIDRSTGHIIAWAWDFGDGHTSGARYPLHTYEHAGTYTVSLTVTSPDGIDIETKTNYITILLDNSYPPVASINFIWYPSAPGPAIQGQDTIYFNGSGYDTDENGAYITAYEWTSGIDGLLNSQEDFVIQASALSTGTHTITFHVRDDEGDWSPEITRTLIVDSPSLIDVRTLILVNRQQLVSLYDDATQIDRVIAKLNELASHKNVVGKVVYVEDDIDVADAYSAWNAKPTNTEKTNDVATAIKALVDEKWQEYEHLEYLVIVGDDRAIPFRRVPDQTRYPESYYQTKVSCSTVTGAALCAGMTLTDDYYADAKPTVPRGPGWKDGHKLYIPDLGVGRLIETPEEIIGQIDAFLATDSTIVEEAVVTGYDFVQDGAQAICNELKSDALAPDCTLVSPEWSNNSFVSRVLDTYHDLASVNGHANHYLLGTPSGHVTSDVISRTTATHTGALFYTMGCHTGLNVSPDEQEPLDLVQACVRHKINYIGNTGYGWGYRYSIGLSEQLMLNLTEWLVYGRSITVGQALAKAKRVYYLDQARFDYYDEKIMIESTLYGLPMYRYNTPSPGAMPLNAQDIGANAVLKTEQVTALGNGLSVNRYGFQFPPFTRTDTDDGSYYAFDGHIYTGDNEPIQPKYVVDLSFPQTQAHGAVFKSGVYTDIYPFTPAIDQVLTETVALDEPVYRVPNWGPSLFYSVNNLEHGDRLVMLLGQFNSNRQTERLYSQQNFDVYYHNDSTDWVAPSIESVHHELASGQTLVTVQANDSSGIEAVIVAYTDRHGTWDSVYLSDNGQTWSGTIPIAAGIEFFVQVVDRAGNVAVDDNEGGYFFVPYRVFLPVIFKNYSTTR